MPDRVHPGAPEGRVFGFDTGVDDAFIFARANTRQSEFPPQRPMPKRRTLGEHVGKVLGIKVEDTKHNFRKPIPCLSATYVVESPREQREKASAYLAHSS